MITSTTFECFGCVYLFLVFGTEFVECFDAALGYHYPASAGSREVRVFHDSGSSEVGSTTMERQRWVLREIGKIWVEDEERDTALTKLGLCLNTRLKCFINR